MNPKGRPVSKKADIEAIQHMLQTTSQVINPRPIIAFTMRKCGCTFTEIGEALKVTKQQAQTIVRNAEKELA